MPSPDIVDRLRCCYHLDDYLLVEHHETGGFGNKGHVRLLHWVLNPLFQKYTRRLLQVRFSSIFMSECKRKESRLTGGAANCWEDCTLCLKPKTFKSLRDSLSWRLSSKSRCLPSTGNSCKWHLEGQTLMAIHVRSFNACSFITKASFS